MAETTAEVIYSAPETAAVHVTTSATGNAAKAAEIALLALYGGHVYADMGRNSAMFEFSSKIVLTEEERRPFLESNEVLGVRVSGRAGKGEARAGFAAWLFHDDEVGPVFFRLANQNHWRLKVRLKGKAKFSSYHYFSTSVAVLLYELAQRNADDRAQQDRLFVLATLLARLHHEGELRLPVRWTEAASTAAQAAWRSVPPPS